MLPRAAHPACAALVERHLRALDHDLRLGCALTGVERRDARLLATLSGATEMFDMAVVCTGSRPNLGMLDGTGLTAADGIDVDERMRSAAPGLLAAGDVARTVDPLTGTRAAVPLWSNARRQGRAAGLAMAGVAASSPGCTPCNIQHAGELLFAAGGSLAAADVVEVDERGEQVEVLGFSGRRLVGFNLLGDVRRAGPLMCALGGERPTGARRSRGAAVPAALAAVREGMTWTTRNAG